MNIVWIRQASFVGAFVLLFAAAYIASNHFIASFSRGADPSLSWVYLAVLHPSAIAAAITLLASSIAVSANEDARIGHTAAIAILIVTCGYQVWVYQSYFTTWPYFLKPGVHLLVGILFLAGGIRVLTRSFGMASSEDGRRVEDGVFGDAAFATVREMKDRFGPDGEVVIGEAYIPKLGSKVGAKPAGKAPLLCDSLKQGSTHGLLIAGSGGYKTTSVILPTLCACDHSCVIFDPKKELADQAERVRRGHGKVVHRLDPNAPTIYGFNALDWIDMTLPSATADVYEVANWIIGESVSQTTESAGAHFQSLAKNLVHALLLDILTDPDLEDEDKTLATLGKRVGLDEDDMKSTLEEIAKYSSHPTAKQMASSLYKLDHRTFSQIHSSVAASAKWLLFENLVGVVSASNFTTADIVEQRADLFIQPDLLTLTTHPGLARVVLGSLLLPMFRGGIPKDSRVVFLLDEVARLGFMSILETARDVGRSAGVTLILMYQSHGQFSDQWGREGTNKWFENVAWRAYGAVSDQTTAEIISKSIGDQTVLSQGQSRSAGSSSRKMEIFGTSSSNQGQSASEQRRRLINPDEILSEVPADAQFIFVQGMPPIFAGRAIYFRRPDLSKWID
ncbi:MAG: type IV secretory system conjugative DNA transfer family protein [Rhodobiaceae bacterium]|nr:type IV secretory system conjugative DNA transfer family protein [Rhodobiaceae bacterium]